MQKHNFSKINIINFIKKQKPFLYKKFGVIKIGLFGSYAKGEQFEDSDIDILVELIEPRFQYIAGLQVYLENKFKKKVEIIRMNESDNSFFGENIKKGVIYVKWIYFK
ncbi:conserved hypothetical protein [Desulfamplus magnetovallimortis]|uniref:Polymerase beta nucleotidyltransferase domain-containing protein n=1 Tax=Desulfamplus magnetovallimortis TaxID=1246637 RepID=A0A1W1HL01_9BACT|nr:nucleotidyltransferase domain-containing protein [Desulfamplus magnetovallimortis]SLM33140.1 conserved hypothetical protein [Desulfamplus magnetovallimortis]